MRTRSLILLLTAGSLATACSHLDQNTQQWLDPDKTFARLDQPTIDGMNATLEKQAIEATQAGEYQKAGQYYKQLSETPKATDDEKFRYKLGMAESARRAGHPEIAVPIYEQLVKEHPDHLDAQEDYGIALMQTGKTVDAGRIFADIMKQDAKRWRTLNALGILFVNKNMIPEAMAYFTEALKQSADNPAILNNVALAQAADRQYARAFDSFEQALRVSGTDLQRKQISLNMAMVYGISGDLDTARDVASKYLSGPALDNNLGLYAHLAKDDALARTYLDMALSGSPTFYERAWNNLDIVEQKKDPNSGGAGAQ